MTVGNVARMVRIGVRLGFLALAALFVWGTRAGTRWPSVYYMTGPSMEPTVAAERFFLTWAPPDGLGRGDLVIFHLAWGDRDFHVLRRLAGLPGDTLTMRGGALFVNGDSMPWPFQVLRPEAWRSEMVDGGDLYAWGPRVVPEDSVFLLSDTRDMVGWPDSRFLGPVARTELVARATRTVWGRRLR